MNVRHSGLRWRMLMGMVWGLCSVWPAMAQSILSFDEVLKEGENPIDGLFGAASVAVSPDGRYVYVAGNADDAVATFRREAAGGTLTFVAATRDNVNGVDGLNGAVSVAVSPDGGHVYVAGEFDDAVAVFSRNDTTGVLSFVEMKKDGLGGVEGLNGARAVVVSPDNRHVYAVSALENALVAFSRNTATGELGFIEQHLDDQNGVDGLNGAVSVAVSPDGRHVYATGNSDDAVAVFSRNDTTGVLSFVEMKKDGLGGVDGLNGAYGVAISPDGGQVYVAGEVDDAVAVFSRNDTTGALSFVEAHIDDQNGVDGLFGAVSVAVSPDGRHVYAAGNSDDAVVLFSRDDSTGALSFEEAEFDGENGVDGLAGALSAAVSPDGAHVYVAGFSENALSTFMLSSSDEEMDFVEVKFEGQDGVDGLFDARFAAVSPDGENVYVANQFGNEVSVFRRDDLTERLAFVEVEHDNSGGVDGLNGAYGVTVSPDGRYVYVAAFTDDGVAVFSRDSATGRLTFVEAEFDGLSGVNGLNGASSVIVSPDSLHVYVTGYDEDAVVVFSRDSATGRLTFVEMQQEGVNGVTGLDGARFAALSPDGRFVYIAANIDDAVAVFSRDSATGRLTFVEVHTDNVSGVDGLNGASSVAVSPDGRYVYASSEADNAVAVFSRDALTGRLAFLEVQKDNVSGVDGLSFSTHAVVSPDGQYVYATGSAESAVAVFSRNVSTGRLTFAEVQKDGRGSVDGLGAPQGIAVSPDGGYVYVVSDFDGMAVFKVNDTAPLSPRQVSASAGEKRVMLSWAANGEVDMAEYRIYRHTADDSTLAAVVLTVPHPDTTATDTTVTNGVTYYYWMTAVDTAGHESLLSPGVQARPADVTPSRPLQLFANAGFRRVTLLWAPNAEADLSHYILYRQTVSSFTPSRHDSIATVFKPDTTFVDTTVVNGTTYYYKITAVDTLGGESEPSPEASALPSGPTAVTLASVAARVHYGVVRLTWQTAVEQHHAGFHILRGPTPEGPFQRLDETLLTPREENRYAFEDARVEINHTYTYRLVAVGTDGETAVVHTLTVTVEAPKSFELAQNFPNPFNPETTIRYALADPAHVRIMIYNALGQTVRTLVDADQAAGFYALRWDGRNDRGERVTSGLYLYRIEAGAFVQARKMIMIK